MVEIVKSFILLCNENNRNVSERSLLEILSEPIMRSFQGVRWAKEQRNNQLVFIKKRKETLINLSDISRVEMIPE
jgi:hypothetical protein